MKEKISPLGNRASNCPTEQGIRLKGGADGVGNILAENDLG